MRKKCDCSSLTVELQKDLENLQLPSPELLTYYKNLEDRVVWLDCDIDDGCLEISRMILRWNKEDEKIPVEERKPIKLLFFSMGGSLEVYESLSDLISLSKTKVIGVNMGIAASAACFIYLNCHERLMLPSAKFLMHKGSVDSLSGTYAEIVAAIDNYEEQIHKLCDKIKEKTKIKQEDLDEKMQSDWWMMAKEAVEYGVCDRIVKDLSEIC